MLELRQGNMLPEGVTIADLIREGRDIESEEARGGKSGPVQTSRS
jgi:hypothetical protein